MTNQRTRLYERTHTHTNFELLCIVSDQNSGEDPSATAMRPLGSPSAFEKIASYGNATDNDDEAWQGRRQHFSMTNKYYVEGVRHRLLTLEPGC